MVLELILLRGEHNCTHTLLLHHPQHDWAAAKQQQAPEYQCLVAIGCRANHFCAPCRRCRAHWRPPEEDAVARCLAPFAQADACFLRPVLQVHTALRTVENHHTMHATLRRHPQRSRCHHLERPTGARRKFGVIKRPSYEPHAREVAQRG